MCVSMNDYITNNWNSIRLKVLKVCRNHPNADDLLNDLYVSLMNKTEKTHLSLLENNKVDNWFTYSAYIQYNSATSPFFKQYVKLGRQSSEIEDWRDGSTEEDENIKLIRLQMIEDVIEELDWYDKEIANRILIKGETQSSVASHFNINRKYISNDIKRIKGFIKQRIDVLWKQ
jgi:RNA polymerase sigma factor (sigma-70 family)